MAENHGQSFKEFASGLDIENPAVKAEVLKAIMKKRTSLKLLIVIVSADKTDKVINLFHIARMHLLYVMLGEGTASSEIMGMLGLGSTAKSVSMCIVPENISDDLIGHLASELELRARGHGIAFTIPLSSAIAPVAKLLEETGLEENDENESGVAKMKFDTTHDLILTVADPGYSDDIMEAAKSSGAKGGTVIHARQAGAEGPIKAWGISIQGEREVIIILAKHDEKKDIMRAINAKFGPTSDAHGITLSLPVDDVEGLET